MVSENTIIYVETVQSKIIKILFDVLKDVIQDNINIVFDQDCIKIVYLSSNEKALITVKLNSSKFEQYICNEQMYKIGVDLTHLNKLTKSIQTKDILSLYIEKDTPDILYIKRYNELHDFLSIHKMQLYTLTEKNICDHDVPDITYKSCLQLNSNLFQQKCKDLDNLTCLTATISYTNTQLSIEADNNYSSNTLILSDMSVSEKDDRWEIHGEYLIKYIVLFTKATALDKKYVSVYLSPEKPLIIEYNIGNLGYIRLLLSPEE